MLARLNALKNLSLTSSFTQSSYSFANSRRFAAVPEVKAPKKKDAKFVPQPNKLYVTLSSPTTVFHRNKEVSSVTVPAVDGMIEYLYQSVQSLTELKPGPLLVKHTDGNVEKFFVAGGYAMVVKDSFCNVVGVEVVKFSDLDSTEATKGLRQAEADLQAAATPEAKVKAQMELETFSNILLEVGTKG